MFEPVRVEGDALVATVSAGDMGPQETETTVHNLAVIKGVHNIAQ